jgi:hypothetical protein
MQLDGRDPVSGSGGTFDGSLLTAILLGVAVVCLLCFYFLPTFIAEDRDFPRKRWVFWVNLILGWTFVGWGVCLLWAACAVGSEQDAYYRRQAKEAAFRLANTKVTADEIVQSGPAHADLPPLPVGFFARAWDWLF